MSNFLIDEDTDLLAAEFVLGTLDSEERANAQSLLRTDHGFIAMVRIWERRFGELHLMVEPVEPDAKIFQRIKAKIVEIAPREPTPEGKPPLGMTPNAGPPAEMAAPVAPATAEMPTLAEPATAGEAVSPPALAADGEPPKPAEPLATGEVPAPDAAPAVSESVAATMPGPEATPAETAAKPENGATANAESPVPPAVTPSPLVEPAEARLDLKAADQRPETRSEPRTEPLGDRRPDRRQKTIPGLIRSRRRWRALGLAMTILVVGLAAMLAAWRFAPDRLPARLRPAEVMMSLGIEPASKPTPAPRRAPPESQFDE
jgi:anti-sigma-K factor RskA